MNALRGLALVIFVLAASLAPADEVRVLVNGRAIETPVIESNGTVYVPVEAISKALGADVKVERGEVRVEQPASPQPVIASAPVMVVFQGAPSIKGKLTYYDHVWQPKKPDVGAKAWLLNAAAAEDLAKQAGGSANEPIPVRATNGVTLLDTFESAAANEDGRFTFTHPLPAGDYLLIAKSKHSNGLAARDRDGTMRFKKIAVAAGKTADVSVDFGAPAYRKEMR